MHEDFTREEEVHASSERSFGIVMAAFFSLIWLFPLLHGAPVRWWALVPAVAFLVLGLFWTAPLRPLNRLWMKFALLLSGVISPVILALLFYATVTPVGLLMRAAGKDPMRRRRDPTATSYWISRDPPGPAPESMKQQF